MGFSSSHGGSSPQIEMTSLVDIVFLLLIFFMVSSSFVRLDDKLDIKLPVAKGMTTQDRQNHLIEVGADGKINLDGTRVTEEVLSYQLRQIARANPNEVIIIRADKRANHGDVVKVLGICKSLRIENIGIAALVESN